MNNKFDAIVVGAGPAGVTAAMVLAKAGLNVVIFERGEYPGSKNMFGGVFYHQVLNELLPNFWEEAPVERYITRRVLTFLSPESSLSVDFKSSDFGEPPYNGFTIARSRFDEWYARKAEEAGAFLVTETTIDDLITENGRVVGVCARRDQGEVYADVVIVADGATSLLAKKAGLRGELSARQMSAGIKEVIALPPETIQERFGLSRNEGMANEFVGSCTRGMQGGAFLYTNKASLSIGVVAQIEALKHQKVQLFELLDDFKRHPAVKDLIRDGVVKEYSAHMIPEAGLSMGHKLYTDGLLLAGDAAGMVVVTGYSLEGVNYAIASGLAAAETVKQAKERGDFSRTSLAFYEQRLKESVLRDLETYRKAPQFLENPRIYSTYSDLVIGMMKKLYTVDGSPKLKVTKLARETMKGNVSLWQAIKDGIQGGRSI